MSPSPLFEIDPANAPARPVRKHVRSVLAEGGIALLPTETVYGLAARADLPAALDKLRALKGRDADHALTWHIASFQALEAFPQLPALVARISKRYWPGPLTLVLEGVAPKLAAIASDGWTGLRLPAHAATRALLDFCDFPVVMSSANASGAEPCRDATSAFETFGDAVDVYIDAGPSRIGESSSVLKVGRGAFELLREGMLSLEDLRRAAGLKLVFVCTGNTCRSPMAEALARELIAHRLGVAPAELDTFGFDVRSAGVFAGAGSPTSEHAVSVLAERGIDASEQRSRPAIPDEIQAADRVYCLTVSHLEALTMSLPPGRAGHIELLDPSGADVPDPIGGSFDEYRRCADHIQQALELRSEGWV